VNLEAFKSGIEKFLQEKHRKAYHCHWSYHPYL
jgi:hypothetical protein